MKTRVLFLAGLISFAAITSWAKPDSRTDRPSRDAGTFYSSSSRTGWQSPIGGGRYATPSDPG